MASTTTNLGLMKPAYSDDADISDINGNMDLIDAEAGRVRANVAANYDSSETYAVGDYCLHDGSLYKCSTAISSPEAWTAGHWTQIKITGELSALNGNLENVSDITLENGVNYGDLSNVYQKSLRKNNRLCILEFDIKFGSTVTSTTEHIFTVPVGSRPSVTARSVANQWNNTGESTLIAVSNTGAVAINYAEPNTEYAGSLIWIAEQ